MLLNDTNCFLIAKSLRGGLFKSFKPIETTSLLIYLFEKCKIKEDDSITDKVFKSLIITGSIMDATEYVYKIGCRTNKNRLFTTSDVSDYIFYEKASDVEISILAKSIYYHTCQNKGFLKWQIDKLIENGDYDYKQESINYQKYIKSLENNEE